QQLKQMLTTVPTGIDEIDGYGLGIYETKLQNGTSIWGHAGGVPGFSTFGGGTLGGKHTLAINLNGHKTSHSVPFKNILLAEFSK
ncbi:alkaline D-peptidase, partial [Bacillus wiedmannii]